MPGRRLAAMVALLAFVTRPRRRLAVMVALLAFVTRPRRRLAVMVALLAFALAACSSGGGGGSATTAAGSAGGPPSTMTVSSTAFQANAAIPIRYTCKGDNTSPPLRWSAPPAGTTELALVVDDPDAPGGTFVHWVLYGIPAGQTQLAEGSVPSGATEGRNSAGNGYMGPCPPSGPAHHYRFTVYALSRSPGVKPDDDPKSAIDAISQAATAQGRLVGTFGT
jgi:Raf kinase inhibitor-like YbhB/YbcL family protein